MQQFQKTDRGMVGAEHGTLFSRFFFLGGGGGGVTQDIPMLIPATKTVLKQSWKDYCFLTFEICRRVI